MKFSKSFKLPNLTFYLPLLVASTAAMDGVLLAQASVLAAESTVVASLNYEQIGQETAIANGINVSVNPGRIAVIDFSTTDEAISYIALGDASRVVYNTDFPIQSGSAQTIFLLPIEELDFPGATTAKITNLVAKTVDAEGVSRVYNFQINHSNSVANLGIKITPQSRNRIADVDRQVIKVSYGRAANLNDVERGLKLAIDRGFTKTNDPVVTKVKRFVALVRNGDLSVLESAKSVDVDLAVISSLAEMALEQFSFIKQDGSSFSALEAETSAESSEKDAADEKGLIERELPKKTSDKLLLRREGDRGYKIQQKFPSVPSTTAEGGQTQALHHSAYMRRGFQAPEVNSGDSPLRTESPLFGGLSVRHAEPASASAITLVKIRRVAAPLQGRERLTKSSNDDGIVKEPKAIDPSDTAIPDLNNESQVELKSEESDRTILSTTGQVTLIDPNEDLSVYLTRVPSVPSVVKKAGSEDNERIENALKAHDLYFGWQRVVNQGILDVDDETEDKVNRAIGLVRRGTPIKTALRDAQVGIQVSSFLLAISTNDTEALASLSMNVARAVQ
ncbi:MAG: hypothetical protein QNJ72_14775 [Pleurocapsa sp. MO_226.B13]|nr:hypothetical protein [Pleurocapsa sp. MO_226.B13]